MAVVIEGTCVIVPLELIAPKHGGAPAYLGATAWHDHYLYCETVPAASGMRDEESGRHQGAADASRLAPSRWRVSCLATQGTGLHAPCEWAQYDAATGTVWHAAHPPGDAFGGARQYRELRERLASLSAQAEASYERMYDAPHPRDERDDALGALSQARGVAKLLGDADAVAQLQARYDHIYAVYRSQFTL